MTKKAIMADKAATSFSCLAMPIATPTAKIIGKLPKMILPASLMMVSSEWSIVPLPRMLSSP